MRPVLTAIRSLRLTAALAVGLSLALPAAAEEDFPRGLAGAYLAARHAGMFSDYAAAAEYYSRALARDSRNPALLENALLAYVGLGELERAVPIALRMDGAGLDSQIANMILIADMLADGDYGRAIEDIDAGRSVGPLVDTLVRAWAELGRGDAEAAMAGFDAAAESTGLEAFALYHKALALALEGDWEGSQTIFSGEGGNPLRLTRRGAIAQVEVLSQLGRNDDAVELIDAGFGTDLDPGLADLRARLVAGETLPFDQIRSVRDGLAEVFYTVAGALDGEANDSYTLLYSRVAEYFRPDHVDAILLTAGLLESQERYDLAVEAYQRVPRDDPSYHVAELGRAAALRQSGREEEAVTVLLKLAASHPEIALVHTTLGDTLRRMERYDEAAAAYDDAIALFAEDRQEQWVVYYARAICHEREGQWDLAEPDFRKALELSPGQPNVLNYLGYSYVEMQSNLDEALAMIEEAVAARPDSGHIVDSLGWVLYRLGRYEEAVGHMERAAELLPVDPIVNDHLGDVYWAVGRKTEARFQWHRALSFDPEEEDATRIRRKLEVGLDTVLSEEGEPPLQVAGDGG